MKWAPDVMALLGFVCVIGGVAAIHWPSALILAGVVLLMGAHKGVNAGVPMLTEPAAGEPAATRKEGKA